jgi:hypothetical protein
VRLWVRWCELPLFLFKPQPLLLKIICFFYWLLKFYNQNYVIFMLINVSTKNIFVTLYNFRLPPFFYMPLFYLLPISTNYNFWICRALQTVRVPLNHLFKRYILLFNYKIFFVILEK